MKTSITKPDLVWFIQGAATLPSVRFRVLPFSGMAGATFSGVTVRKIPKTFLQRIHFYASLERLDICILQKRLLSCLELRILRRKSRLLVYDFDDAVWTEQDAPRSVENGQHSARFRNTCRQADLVVAGNACLAAAVPPGVPVFVMPSPLDTLLYAPSAHKRSDSERPRLGWMGTSSYLPLVVEVFRELAGLDLPMRIVSNKEPEGAPTGVLFTKWSDSAELELLRDFDIGLMPLEDTYYARGKGGFKLLQYMACGVVPVASAVGINREIIRHGVDGFLVKPGESWRPFVEKLQDAGLRDSMAQAARNSISKLKLR